MMKNYDESVEVGCNTNWVYIPSHPYKVLMIGGSGSGKTIVLVKLIKHKQPNVDKINFYVKDLFELTGIKSND